MSERTGSENDIRGSFTPGACRWWLHRERTFWRQGWAFFLTGSSCRKAVDVNHDTQQNSLHILSLLGIWMAINVSNSFSGFAALWVSGTHFRAWWQQRNIGHGDVDGIFAIGCSVAVTGLHQQDLFLLCLQKHPLRSDKTYRYLDSLFHGLFSPHSMS